jgi:hypothetical protein
MNADDASDELFELVDVLAQCRTVIFDGDLWLLSPDKRSLLPVGHTRIPRQLGNGSHGGDITMDDVEDVRDMYQRLVLERLADIPSDDIKVNID